MKQLSLVLLTFFVFLSMNSFASESADRTQPPAPALPAASTSHNEKLPGVDLAQGISAITGTAISPLLGVSGVGAWRYFQTPANLRHSLPWFCQPAFWGPAFGLLLVGLLKDSLGLVGLTALKKPLDMLELFESKLSALVASAAFVPLIASEMAKHYEATGTQGTVPLASIGTLGVVFFDYRLLFIPLALFAFLVVWMTSHAINVLIALCPFGYVDTMLKGMKALLLSLVTGSCLIYPPAGAAISLLLIFVAIWLAPSAFRLTVFGTLFARDTILPWRARRKVSPDKAHAFLGKSMASVPARTYGRLTRGLDGKVHFSFRPWLILPQRSVALPAGSLAISRGIYYPSLLHLDGESGKPFRTVIFLPRYRSHERAIADHFDITEVRDSPISRGLKAAKAWLSDMLRTRNPEIQKPAA
jgi:hypothetical protein